MRIMFEILNNKVIVIKLSVGEGLASGGWYCPHQSPVCLFHVTYTDHGQGRSLISFLRYSSEPSKMSGPSK